MTALAITPNWKNKSAKFRGTIAAGEHVTVSIINDDGSGNAFVTSTTNLRLNVIDPATGRLLATFPEPVEEGETPETWGNDTTPLTCTLNLNTVQMLMAVPPAANVPLLFVLDDYEAKTLYFKDTCEVTHWPRRVGEEEPLDLDGYQDFVAETEAALAAFGTRLTAAEDTAAAASQTATAASATAANAATLAGAAKTAAESAAASAAEIADRKADLVDGKVPASELPSYVDDVLEFDYESFPSSGIAAFSDAVAYAVGDRVTYGSPAKIYIFTAAHAAGDWTGEDVRLATAFPATGESGKIYVALDTNKTYRWSGSAYVEIANPDLDDAVTRTSGNGVKSSGIWSAIWGALTALPTDFTSLYDWVVSQLAGKASTADATLTARSGFSDWSFSPSTTATGHAISMQIVYDEVSDVHFYVPFANGIEIGNRLYTTEYDPIATSLTWGVDDWVSGGTAGPLVATRTALQGYQLGSQSDKPLASEAEAEALRSGKQDSLTEQQLDNIAAVPNKADAADLRYNLTAAVALIVSGGAASMILADRTHKVATVAAPGSGNTTTITLTLPAIVSGKSRDMFLNLTVGTQASDAGDISLSIVEPSGATVQIDIGSVEDIGIGKNEILISENALPTTSGNVTTTHWLVTVRHEDFAS